jgi:formylglycine-generating enzyme required for sulfatase activity
MPGSINFRSDKHSPEDLLGFERHIDTLADMIKDRGFETPFCIGIFGKWGSGKTSFMHQLEDRLRSSNAAPHPITVWFNPWRYEREEHLIVPFLKTIEKELSAYCEQHEQDSTLQKSVKKVRDGAKLLGRAAAAIAYGSKFEFQVLGLKYGLDVNKAIDREETLDKRDVNRAKERSAELISLYYDVIAELKKTVDEKEFRIIVFVDDLDRCLPEKAVELLESIKLFLDLEGYVFVLGVDREVIERGIAYRYRFYEQLNSDQVETKLSAEGKRIISPEEYMDKIIQVPLDLPPIEPELRRHYVESLLGKGSRYCEWAGLIERGVESNPRSLKRFVNFLAFMGRLAEKVKKDIMQEAGDQKEAIENGFIPALYVKWALIVFGYRLIYNRIKGNPGLLIDLQKEATEGKASSGSGLTDSLKEILLTGPLFPDSEMLIEKYVYLAASTDTSSKKTTGQGEPSVLGKLRPGDMVLVKKGSFLYGDHKAELNIPYDYWIDAFPLTNRQYQEFLQDPEYPADRKPGVPFVDADWARPYNWDKKTRQCPKDREDHPVVLVSFEDAEKFCDWRSLKEGLKGGKSIRLPTEEEWEKAARGIDGREYPWGDKFDADLCNTGDADIGETTSVTKYPKGVSPFGCYDMAGNVWEWTDSLYDKNQEVKVLRGGSWYGSHESARCAYRGRDWGTWDSLIGFRCARTAE